MMAFGDDLCLLHMIAFFTAAHVFLHPAPFFLILWDSFPHPLLTSSVSLPVFIARLRMRTFGFEEGEGCCARLTAFLLLWVLLCDLTSLDLPYLAPLRRETYLNDHRPMRRLLSGAFACDWFILPFPYLTLPHLEPLYSSCPLSLGSWQSISLACHCH